MRCLQPVPIRNTHYMSDHLNSSTFYFLVPCGKCANCLRNRSNQWTFRLEKELDASDCALFVTLTYDDDHLPFNESYGVVSVSRRDVQLFFKRLRKTTKKRLKYFLTSEYGERFGRPHYHMILFNYDKSFEMIESCWKNGFVRCGSVTPASIRYVSKYFVTPQEVIPVGSDKPFSLASKGLGLSYLTSAMVSYIENHKSRPYLLDNDGEKVSFPRYYRKKLPFSLDLRNVCSDSFDLYFDRYDDPFVAANRFNCDVLSSNLLFSKNRKKSNDL